MEAPQRQQTATRPARIAAGGLSCLQASDPERVAARKLRRLRERGGSRRSLRCAACGHLITDDSERIAMGGAHLHHCTNLAGYSYDIGCYRAAPGCGSVGEATAGDTWFAGYRWQIAVCGSCGAHLGWRYANAGSEAFYGLINVQLVPEQ